MTETLDDIHLADPTFWKRSDKFDILARFRRERPIARQPLPDAEGYYWSLTRHKETREVTRNAVIGAVSDRGQCDFATDVATRMSTKVICDMLRVPEGEDRDELARLTTQAQGYGDESVGDTGNSLDAFYAINAYGEEPGCARRVTKPG